MDKNEKIKNCLLSVLKAAAYFGCYLGVQIILGFLLSIFFGISAILGGTHDIETFLYDYTIEITLFANILSILGCIALSYFLKGRERRVERLLDINVNFGHKGKIIAACLFLGVVGQFSITLILSLIPFPQQWHDLLEENSQAIINTPILLQILSVAIVAPIAEEIIFRACIQGSLQGGMHKWAAIIITSLIFGVMHANPIGIIYATSLGILMGWLYAELKSIVPSMLFHLSFNLTSLFITEKLFENPIAFFLYFIISTALFGLCIGYIAYQIRAAQKDNKNSNSQGDNDNEAL